MVNTCSVPNCKNRGNVVKMHRFPDPKTELFKRWIRNIGNPALENKDPQSVHRINRVCDIHFSSEYRLHGRSGSNLRSDSVPTLHLPEMDPLCLSLLEGMDQIEVVIDSDEDEHSSNEDISNNEMEEQDDIADENYVPEDSGTTSSNDVEIIDSEPRNDADEVVPFKKMKISNVMSVSTGTEKDPLLCFEELPGTPSNETPDKIVRYKANIKQIISSDAKPATGNIVKSVSSSLTKKLPSNKENSDAGSNTPAVAPAKSVSVMPLIVPGSSNVVSSAIANVNPSPDVKKVVILPNQQDFPLEEDPSRHNPCFIPGCKIYKNEQMFAFGVPRSIATLQIWDMCINNKVQKLDFNHVICYKHFAQEDVIHNIKIVNKNGLDIAVDEPKLRKGALPCVKFWERCCVPGCDKTTGRMYIFPVANKSNLHLWLYLIRNPELKKLPMKELLRHRVCEIHFETDSFDNEGGLLHPAAPTLFLPESTPPIMPQINQRPRYKGIKRCAFKDCMTMSNSSKKQFSFPVSFQRILSWLGACNRPDLIKATLSETVPKLANLAVCEDHFELDDFEDSMMYKLKDSAVPKKWTPPKGDGAAKRSQAIKLTPIMTKSCIYRGCSNKTTEDKQFFFFPSDKYRYEDWITACGYRDCKSYYAFRICRDHFLEEMFDKSGWLLDTATPIPHPDPKGVPMTTPIFHQKRFPNPGMSSQKIRTNGKMETVLNYADKREVRIIQEDPTSDDEQDEENEANLICAVKNCKSVYKESEGKYHKFPDPKTDFERYDLWLKLVANSDLARMTKEEIGRKYMVCARHFEQHFYFRRSMTGKKYLSKEAVPTLNLPADSCLLKEWDYYHDKLKKYMDAAKAANQKQNDADAEEFYEEPSSPEPKKPVITSWVSTEAVRLSDLENKTRCVLGKDGLSFPGMGCNLNIISDDKKKKFPYNVYRVSRCGYGLTNQFEFGDSVHIHTAIIIDDDDECERKVLQQLLDRRKK